MTLLYRLGHQVFKRELLPLWILTLFFACYATVRLVRAISELGHGERPGKKFSLARSAKLLTYHVSPYSMPSPHHIFPHLISNFENTNRPSLSPSFLPHIPPLP